MTDTTTGYRRTTAPSATALLATAIFTAYGLLPACGIDQGGARMPAASGGAAPSVPPPAAIVTGPISGFGSVIVNGVHMETAGARITIGGNPASESALRVGQVVRAVASTDSSGTRAVAIEYQANVVGPVAAIDLAAGTFQVLGQSFTAGDYTSFENLPLGLADLGRNDMIEVSGLTRPDESIRATYVGRRSATDLIRVVGLIDTTDTAAFTFQFGPLPVNYSTPSLLDLPGGLPTSDLLVEGTGTPAANGSLLAEGVRAIGAIAGRTSIDATALRSDEPALVGSAIEQPPPLTASLEGYITATNLPTGVSLRDVAVTIRPATSIDGGSLQDLQAGTLVRVEGDIAATGEIDANTITVLADD